MILHSKLLKSPGTIIVLNSYILQSFNLGLRGGGDRRRGDRERLRGETMGLRLLKGEGLRRRRVSDADLSRSPCILPATSEKKK